VPTISVRHAAGSIGRFVGSFHPRAFAPMLRPSYAREIKAWFFLPLMLGAVEGGTISIVVKKAFSDAPEISPWMLNLAVATVTAAPAVANITSFVWATIAHGRAKVPFISTLQIVTAILVAMIAFVPHNGAGLVALVTLVVLARVMWTGVITIRTTVWAANYPRSSRARVAGKIATVQSLSLTAAAALVGVAMDFDERAFHILFPLAAVAGIVGNAIYRRVRMRGHRLLVADERSGPQENRPTLNPGSVVRVLRDDPAYRRFMRCMFTFGLGNLMITAPLAIVLNDGFGVGYLQGILITSAIPTALMPLSIPLWSRLLDRCNVVEFRAIHSWAFVLAALLQFIGALFLRIEFFFIAAALTGIAFGGGVLAWNLGHHDFAPRNRDSQYMGVHVTLTGLRGLIAPFLAVGIYDLLDRRAAAAVDPTAADAVPPGAVVAALDAIGAGSVGGSGVFGVCLLLNLIGAIGFVRMRRDLRRGHLTLQSGH